MIVWVASRMAGSMVGLLGGSPGAVDAARLSTAAIGSLVDPIGGLVGMTHAGVAAEARAGSPGAKLANLALMIGGIATGGLEFPSPEELTDVV